MKEGQSYAFSPNLQYKLSIENSETRLNLMEHEPSDTFVVLNTWVENQTMLEKPQES